MILLALAAGLATPHADLMPEFPHTNASQALVDQLTASGARPDGEDARASGRPASRARAAPYRRKAAEQWRRDARDLDLVGFSRLVLDAVLAKEFDATVQRASEQRGSRTPWNTSSSGCYVTSGELVQVRDRAGFREMVVPRGALRVHVAHHPREVTPSHLFGLSRCLWL